MTINGGHPVTHDRARHDEAPVTLRLMARLYEERVPLASLSWREAPAVAALLLRRDARAVRVARWEVTLTDRGVDTLRRRTGVPL